MKSKFLKINKPCAEKWENMKPNEKGSFCDVCSKNVIDLTQLSQVEISNEIKKANGNICARITQSQINTPLFDFDTRREYKIPFSNIAAGLMIATTLTACQTNQSEQSYVQTEFVLVNDSDPQSERTTSNSTKSKAKNISKLKGNVINEQGEPIENARITFVTLSKLLTTFTLKDGSFTLVIPEDLVDDDNVVRVSYNDIKIDSNEDEKEMSWGYEVGDYILSREDLNSNYQITAEPLALLLGGIGSHSQENHPIVISNGMKIKYNDFVKARRGEKSSCSMENREYLFFESNAAVALYGEEAKFGLFLLKDKADK